MTAFPRRHFSVLLAVIVVAMLATGCSAKDESAAAPGRASAASARADDEPITKLMVVVVENHSLREMRRQMPYAAGLADRYGYATSFRALTHPSLPNYLGLVGGRRFGVTDDDPPLMHPIRGASVFGQALAAGRSARVYADAMTNSCRLNDESDRYAVRHNPWTYFVDERAECARHDVALGQLADDVLSGRLPNAGMLVPDLCHDAHDCSLPGADRWLRSQLAPILAGPDFASGRLAVVLTADEDDRTQGNRVLTAVIHPSLERRIVHAPLTTYSLTRLYDEVLGTRLLGKAADARSIADTFGLPL